MTPRILIAFDESPQATAALHHVLSTYTDAEIHVLYVRDPREWVSADDMDGFYAETADRQSQETAEQLLEYAEVHDIDHIVLGSHGRRGLSRFLVGSVAERVVRRSPGSVTIIREEAPAEAP